MIKGKNLKDHSITILDNKCANNNLTDIIGDVSVIIPCYNYAHFLEECVESVISQTYLPKEIIIVDDCSTDSSSEVIRKLEKKYNIVKGVFQNDNGGVSRARNTGVIESTSEYVTFIDADDVMGNEKKIENEMKLINTYKREGKNICAYSKIKYIDIDGNELGDNFEKNTVNGKIHNTMLTLFDTSIVPRDICIKKELLCKAGGYREDMSLYEDYELILRLSKDIEFYSTNEIGTSYRIKEGGLSDDNIKKLDRVFMNIFNEYVKSEALFERPVLYLKKMRSMCYFRGLPYIKNKCRKIKHLLKKTYLYKIKEKIWQNEEVIFLRCCFAERLKGYLTKSAKIISMKEYQGLTNTEITTVEKSVKRTVFCPKYYKIKNAEQYSYESPEIYIAEIGNAGIISGCGAIFTNKGCILDILANDKEGRVDFVTPPVFRYKKEKKRIYYRYKTVDKSIEKGIMLVGVAPTNYYHFAYEILSRLPFVEDYCLDKNVPILIDESALQISQLNSMLEKMNVHNRPIIPIKADVLYIVKHLIYPSMNTWFPVNLVGQKKHEPYDFIVSKTAVFAVRNIKNIIINEEAYNEKKGKKIFLSRLNYGYSRFINEKEIVELFEEYGFESVYTGDLSFEEQVKLFDGADVVAGATGAAFANIAFCRPGTKIICIIPNEYDFSLYSTIAGILELETVFLDAIIEEKNENLALSKYSADVVYCRKYLEEL